MSRKFYKGLAIGLLISVAFWLLVARAHCEELPKAPSSTKSWILFTVVASADVASSVYDSKITWDGLNSGHGCSEANSYLGAHPSQGALYGKNMAITGGIVFAGFAMKKWLHLPIAPYAAMGVDTFKHAHGVHSWYTFKDGACL